MTASDCSTVTVDASGVEGSSELLGGIKAPVEVAAGALDAPLPLPLPPPPPPLDPPAQLFSSELQVA